MCVDEIVNPTIGQTIIAGTSSYEDSPEDHFFLKICSSVDAN